MTQSNQKYNILIVDDTPENLRLLAMSLVSEGYSVRVAPNGYMAINMAKDKTPDIIILDIDMPTMNGYEVADHLKANDSFREVPIIFLSAFQDTHAKIKAFNHGAVDYASKPFAVEELLARIATHLELYELRQTLDRNNRSLNLTLHDKEEEIFSAQISTIVALAKLAESRDDDTGLHIDRVGNFSQLLAKTLLSKQDKRFDIDEQFVDMIYHVSALHDIGKVGIADAILRKPGKLTEEEFETMKMHPMIGFKTLNTVLKSYPNNKMVRMGSDIAKSHHEKWNGSGYPEGIKGENIPLSARIVAIADVYDALRATRPYKTPFSHEQAVSMILEGSEKHFDPRLIDIFEHIHSEFDRVWVGITLKKYHDDLKQPVKQIESKE